MKTVIDFGLLVLIWLVQLIIYPSFQYIDKAQLAEWHAKYTVLITFVVMPLMFGQVILHALQLFRNPNAYNIIQVMFIASIWIITFLKAVPLHNYIQQGHDLENTIPSLIIWNWPRTVLWTLVFFLSALRS